MDALDPKDKVNAFIRLYDMVVPKEARNQLHQPVAPVIQINFTPASRKHKKDDEETIDVEAKVIEDGKTGS